MTLDKLQRHDTWDTPGGRVAHEGTARYSWHGSNACNWPTLVASETGKWFRGWSPFWRTSFTRGDQQKTYTLYDEDGSKMRSAPNKEQISWLNINFRNQKNQWCWVMAPDPAAGWEHASVVGCGRLLFLLQTHCAGVQDWLGFAGPGGSSCRMTGIPWASGNSGFPVSVEVCFIGFFKDGFSSPFSNPFPMFQVTIRHVHQGCSQRPLYNLVYKGATLCIQIHASHVKKRSQWIPKKLSPTPENHTMVIHYI